MSHIKLKLKGTEHRAPCKHILCPYTHPKSQDGVTRSNIFFPKVVMLLIKLKGMKNRAPYNQIFSPGTPSTPGVGLKVKTFFY